MDGVCEKAVLGSVRRYGTAKAISRVMNELLRESLSARREL